MQTGYSALICCILGGVLQLTSSNLNAASENLPAQSASLLYIYASDSIDWKIKPAKLLRDNETLLILPDVIYKIWCETQPEGMPRINTNTDGVIAHQPVPMKTMTHVELERDIFTTLKDLNSGSKPVKLWCRYYAGANEHRTEVYLKPFIIANTTCDFSQLNGLVARGSNVNFVCNSTFGYPRPEHWCDLVAEDGAFKMPADVVSAAVSDNGHAITRFSMLATAKSQSARIECFTKQEIVYKGGRDFSEIRSQRVLPHGKPNFIFAVESNKSCEFSLSGDYGVSVRCQSEAGLPETEHKCYIRSSQITRFHLLLKKKIQGRSTYITAAAFNNSWLFQAGTLTCFLTQAAFFGSDFTYDIPAFKESTKSCKFTKLNSPSGVQAECRSSGGWPASDEHTCAVTTDSGVISVQPSAPSTHGNLSSIFFVPDQYLKGGAEINCSIKQKEFGEETFRYSVPRSTESSKVCQFTTLLSRDVRAVCEFSEGHPPTHTECSYLPSNSSEVVSLKSDSLDSKANKQLTQVSYITKFPSPEVPHLGGSVVCKVFQNPLWTKIFVHQVPGYYVPETTTTLPSPSTTATTPAQTTSTTPLEPSTTITMIKSSTTTVSSTPRMLTTLSSLTEMLTTVDTNSKTLDSMRTTAANALLGATTLSTQTLSTQTLSTQTLSTQTRSLNPGKPQKGAPPILLTEKRAGLPPLFLPATIPSAAGTTEQPQLLTSNQAAMSLSLALLIALVIILLMSLSIHILRRCLARSRKAATASSLGEIQVSAATLLSSAAPVRRVHLVHPPHQLQMPSEDELRAVLCDVCNLRGYRGSKRDAIPDIDQYSMFEVGYQLMDPSNNRKSLLVDAQVRSELNHNRKEFRFSM